VRQEGTLKEVSCCIRNNNSPVPNFTPILPPNFTQFYLPWRALRLSVSHSSLEKRISRQDAKAAKVRKEKEKNFYYEEVDFLFSYF